MNAQSRIRQIKKQAERQGWTVTLGRGGHYRFYPPEGHPEMSVMTVSTSPGNTRALNNCIADLKRSGVIVDPPKVKHPAHPEGKVRVEASVNDLRDLPALVEEAAMFDEVAPGPDEAQLAALADMTPTLSGISTTPPTKETSPMTTPAPAASTDDVIDRADLPPGMVIASSAARDRYGIGPTAVWFAIEHGYLTAQPVGHGPKPVLYVDPDALDRAPILERGKAAIYADVSVHDIDDAAASGALHRTKVGERERRFAPADVRAWKARRVDLAPPPAPATVPVEVVAQPDPVEVAPYTDGADFLGTVVVALPNGSLVVQSVDGTVWLAERRGQ